jgi:hypothetical protein
MEIAQAGVEAYRDGWNDYIRRRNALLIVFLGYLPWGVQVRHASDRRLVLSISSRRHQIPTLEVSPVRQGLCVYVVVQQELLRKKVRSLWPDEA